MLRLNRPHASNALTWTLIRDIGSAIVEAESDPEVRAVVITGTGTRAFCAGEDLRSVADGDHGSVARSDDAFSDYLRLLHGEVAVPVIGAANGTAVAGGFELLLGCDVVVASSEARFGLPEVKRGLFAGSGVVYIGQRLPLPIALELSLTGDLVSAPRAHELGLVNSVVEPDDVLRTAMDFADRIASNAPLAIAATKELVRAGASGTATDARLRELQAVVFGSDDAKEGALACLEKRAPVWRGR